MTDTSDARDETAADLFRDDYEAALARGDHDAARKADALELYALGGEYPEDEDEASGPSPSDIQGMGGE